MKGLPPTVEWCDGIVRLLDQTLLPAQVKFLDIKDTAKLWDAIKRLAVRGAPAIGVSAAYGVVLGIWRCKSSKGDDLIKEARKTAKYLATSRPTAVNLFWALDRMVRKTAELEGESAAEVKAALLAEAMAIHAEDRRLCASIGKHGAALVKSGYRILTHCNAGALATGGMGTALSLFYTAKAAGKKVFAWVDETRPLLQGARLTAWELNQSGIPLKLICDNMAAKVMGEGLVDMVVVGADRIAANGDTANKIGTYGVATLAKAHGVPFYVAAPSSTFDLACPEGKKIPIEERDADEVAGFGGVRTAPEGIQVYNPAFDVTPARLITGIITERGVVLRPTKANIKRHFEKA